MSTWIDDRTLQVDSTQFTTGFSGGSTATHFVVSKEHQLLVEWIELLGSRRFPSIVELGINEGASTALIALLARPDHLVAVDIAPAVPPALATFIETTGLASSVRVHCGVDQGDADQLLEVMTSELDGPADLIIDDASHLYELTRSSFETLFPLLAPGGLYVIEDWNWEHRVRSGRRADPQDLMDSAPEMMAALEAAVDARRDEQPLHRLGLELALARAGMGGAIGRVTLTPWWVVVERGEAPLVSGAFALADLVEDHFGLLCP